MSKIEKLFEPIMIGPMEVRNRIVMPAICSNLGSAYGEVTQKFIDYYVERAKGGAGLIVIENTCVEWPRGKAGVSPIRIDDWKYVPGLHELARAVQAHGAKIATQLHHTGRQNSPICTEETELVAPSAVPCPPTGAPMPHELDEDEIEELEEKFVIAAQRTKWAGFDAVELHGAHGYLISQFLSPFANKRDDDYGDDLDGRMLFVENIIEGIRGGLGDFPIIFRISGDEFIEGGLTIEDTKEIAERLEEMGVDCISVSAGIYESKPWFSRIFPVMSMDEGCNVPLAEAIKDVVDIPVIIVGKLGDPLLAEKVLQEEKADLIAMGRQLLADPDLPNKVKEGRLDDIRPCLYCNECYGAISKFWPVSCQVNPDLGKEAEAEIKLAENIKNVMVVGGGPGGMEAARVAAERGHRVTLYDMNDRLGGQLVPASAPWFKEPIRNYIGYLENQVKNALVKIELNTEVTPEDIRDKMPDVLIVSTGASPITCGLPGMDQKEVVNALDILIGEKETTGRVVIIGGGYAGTEAAWVLSEKDKDVTVVEMMSVLAEDMNMVDRFYLLNKLEKNGVKIMTDRKALEVTAEGVVVESSTGKKETVEADTIVWACGSKSEKGLYESVKDEVKEVHVIGDCVKPGKIQDAVHQGSWVGRRI